MEIKPKYSPKPIFIERIKKLLKNESDAEEFFKTSLTVPPKSIRVNTLKISAQNLKQKLESKGWKLKQPINKHPEIMIVENDLDPGELGKSKEHLLGYYYIQKITSMMPILALKPTAENIFLDLCAAPGSKTTQAAMLMQNKGTIIANDISIGKISILSANLERIGATNTIITRYDGLQLTKKLRKLNMKFDKILVDAPCSGEGNIRTSPRTYLEWSENLLKKLSDKQKKLASSVIPLLKQNREMIYSTCTYAPEENEEVIQYLLNNFDIKLEKINLPIKTRPGILEWKDKKFSSELKKAVRIYHHDNNTEGFFLCKIKKK